MDEVFDSEEFRAALGRFATGVTVVTTCDEKREPVGVTANSFNSVSLAPPLILWSLGRSSRSMAAFYPARHFAVHVLSSRQEHLSDRFASRDQDKFAGVPLNPGEIPLLEGCSARFMCETVYRYEGGDHVIFVGRVLDFASSDDPPLLYHAGRYAEARPRLSDAPASIEPVTGRVASTSLLNLIFQAHTQLIRPLRTWLAERRLEQPRFLILSATANLQMPTRAEVIARVSSTGYEISDIDIDTLVRDGLVLESSGRLSLSDRGKDDYVELLVRLKSLEEDIVMRFTVGEVADVKRVLAAIVELTADGAPGLLPAEPH